MPESTVSLAAFMEIDYLWSECQKVHAINCKASGSDIEIGVLCCIALRETTLRIANEHHSFLVDIPDDFRSGGEKVKGFNIVLTVLNHEQV
jgi:hypothetical protein